MKDGSVLSIYSHWDNFPEHNGRILQTHYNTREKVAELIDLGDCSSIWTDTIWGQPRTDGRKYGPEPYSARGEDCPPRIDKNLKQFIENGEEYGYIFRNGEWICYNTRSWDENFGKEETIPQGALAC